MKSEARFATSPYRKSPMTISSATSWKKASGTWRSGSQGRHSTCDRGRNIVKPLLDYTIPYDLGRLSDRHQFHALRDNRSHLDLHSILSDPRGTTRASPLPRSSACRASNLQNGSQIAFRMTSHRHGELIADSNRPGLLDLACWLGLLGSVLAGLVVATSVLRLLLHSIRPADRPAAYRPGFPEYFPSFFHDGTHLYRRNDALYRSRHLFASCWLPGRPSSGSAGGIQVKGSAVEVHPCLDSFFKGGNALRVDFSGGAISRIAQISDGLLTIQLNSSLNSSRICSIVPVKSAAWFALKISQSSRGRRSLRGRQAVLRAWRPGYRACFRRGVADLRIGHQAQGASTIDMQVARSFFFTTKREWRRKVKEVLMAVEIDQRYSKQQIFELYANEIYLGNRGSFPFAVSERAPKPISAKMSESSLGKPLF